MRTRARVYLEPQLSESERSVAVRCPRSCGAFLSEERQRGANGAWAEVLFCLNEACAWREWAVEDIGSDVERLASAGARPAEIALQLGVSERTVFRRLAKRAA